jgi:hypothetical protein
MPEASAATYVFGRDAAYLGFWSYPCYMTMAVVASLLLLVQLLLLRRLKVLSAYFLLPLLSISVAYENFTLFFGAHNQTDEVSHLYIGYILNSLIVPMFLLIQYELVFKLHEFRNAHFFCFELEVDAESVPAKVVMWIMRLVCLGLVAVKLIVEFEWLGVNHSNPEHTGSAGYSYFAEESNSTSVALWFALLPSVCLSLFGAMVAVYIFKYGTYVALDNHSSWKFASFAIVGQIVGQCFGYKYYPVTSNAGEVLLLVGMTYLVYLAQYELSMAASYADFLHRSNSAFKAIAAVKVDIELGLTRDKAVGGGQGSGAKAPRVSGRFVADFVRKHKSSIDRGLVAQSEVFDEVEGEGDGVAEDEEESETNTDEEEWHKIADMTKAHGGSRLPDDEVLPSELENSAAQLPPPPPRANSKVPLGTLAMPAPAQQVIMLDLSEF